MTHEELAAAVQTLMEDWGRTEKPKHLLVTENNVNHIIVALNQHIQSTGVLPTTKEVTAFVRNMGDMDNGGKLQYHKPAQVIVQRAAAPPPPAPPNPADNLPFAEIKELDFLKSVEAVQRFQARVEKDGLSYMSGFKRLRPNSTKDYEELNARLTYIMQNEIHVSDLPTDDLVPQSKLKPRIIVHHDIAEAHKAVDNMTLADVGSVGSSAGRRTSLANKQERLHADIDQMLRTKTPSTILQLTKEAIKKFGSSSVN